jgi:hypothetical protein
MDRAETDVICAVAYAMMLLESTRILLFWREQVARYNLVILDAIAYSSREDAEYRVIDPGCVKSLFQTGPVSKV